MANNTNLELSNLRPVVTIMWNIHLLSKITLATLPNIRQPCAYAELR